jgi:predicted negative regulator of RcsB-dependent stress response
MYDLEEQEQIDALKSWWKENGRLVVVAVFAALVAAAGVMGWRYWQGQQAAQASVLYAELEKAMSGNDHKQVQEVAARIMRDYARTAYGPMAALVAAKIDFDAGNLPSAGSRLAWALERARDQETAAAARLRLAGVRLDEKKYAEALQLLEQEHPESFDGLYADLRGDVLVAQGKMAEAKAAYRLALEKLPADATYRMVVQIKLDGLGGAQ